MFRRGMVGGCLEPARWKNAAAITLATALGIQAWSTPLRATDFTVTNPADDGSAGTLRWAIEQANAAGAGTHTISFSVPANSTIELTDDLPQLDNSAATIELDGIGAGGVTISGHNNHRVLFVAAGNWYVRNVNIHNGLAAGGDGGSGGSGGGGGGLGAGGAVFINTGASLTIRNVNFNNNNASGGDGGLTGGNSGGGGGGGLGGDGGNVTGSGGGGGGGAGIFASGGNGSSLAGGGGGGLVLPGGNALGPFGGFGAPLGGNGGDVFLNGQSGPAVGGGGGGGDDADGGAGGAFGGGGGAGSGSGNFGGNGGFGGGGGGAGTNGGAGQGGFGAGSGGSSGAQGQGGSGLGGAIFVMQGGTFNIENSHTTNNNVAAGDNAGPNTAQGQDLYLMQGVTATFQNTSSNNNTFTGSIAGLGALTVQNGTTILTGTNTYEGGTSVLAGILEGNTNSLQGDISDGATVRFNQSFDGTFFGAITGAGQVIKTGTGNVTLSDPNNFGGGTLISQGTLTATTANLTGAVTSNATFVLDQSFDGTYFGAITGTGQLVKNGTGNVTLGNTSNAIGSIAINAGTLTGDASTLNATSIANDAALVFNQTSAGTTNAVITGAGTVTKSGSGELFINSTGNSASAFSLQDGLVSINGNFTSNFTTEATTILSGNGTIIGNVHSDGVVSPGNSIGTLHITGDYTTGSSSVQWIEINGGGTVPGVNNDVIAVGGDASLHGVLDIINGGGPFTAGMTYHFLSASSITGNYDLVALTGMPADLHAVVGFDFLAGQEWAYFTLLHNQTNFLANAETYNERQVAIYLDDTSATATGQYLHTLDQMQLLAPPEQRQAMNELTGVVNGTIAQLGVQDTTFLYQMLRRRVGSAFASGGLVSNGNSSDWTTDTDHPGERLILPCDYKRSSQVTIMSTSASSIQSPWAGWTTGYGFGGSAKSDGNAAGGTFGSGGTIFALERALDSSTLFGLFGAYSHLGLSLSGLPQSASANQGLFGAYLLKDFERGYVLAAGSAGFAGYKETRQMVFGNVNQTANGSYDGWQPTSYLELGRRYAYGSTTIQPYVATQYVYVRQNGFTETGAGDLNQQVNGIDTHALRGLLGARASQVWRTSSGQTWVPELRAVWMHEFLDPTTTLTAIFAPVGGSSFATRGLDFGRDWAILGGGTQFVMSQNVSLFANYDLLLNGQQVWNAGSGGLQFSW